MSAPSLAHPRLTEHNGLWYLLGYADGQHWLQKSIDGGETWLQFASGETRSSIGPSDNAPGCIVIHNAQGNRLIVLLCKKPHLHCYISPDDGDTWTLESIIDTA